MSGIFFLWEARIVSNSKSILGAFFNCMTAGGSRNISTLIDVWGRGDQEALNLLVSMVYPELRRIARRHLGRRSSGRTLESAALANEAYLRLVRAGVRCENRVHFLALCSQIIRRILVDYARRGGYAKRGGGAVRVPLDEEVAAAQFDQSGILALDLALESLSKVDPRKSKVVELRCFGGLSVEEAAQSLGVSPETARRDWKFAKAWLLRRLGSARRRDSVGVP
jgi:RNA polymerase sigma-70 factor, ECF subfamily